MRNYVKWAACAVVVLAGCKLQQTQQPDVENTKRRANAPAILVLLPNSKSANDTLRGIQTELADDFDIVPRFVGDDASASDVRKHYSEVKPQLVVLMNNPTLRAYRKFLAAVPDASTTPVVGVLTSFLREASRGIDKLSGVVYEVPLVTSLVNLRQILGQPLRKVGVIHRKSFAPLVAEQRALANLEGFELVSAEVEGDSRRDVRDAIGQLSKGGDVDAIWVLNDNALLQRDLILRGWFPALRKNKAPVVVNVGSMISSRIDFGTFAVLPDHRALGLQAAQMISDIADNGFQVSERRFEFPLSVETVLNLKFARRKMKLEEERIATIDRVIE